MSFAEEKMHSHLTELVQKWLLFSHQVLARQVREMAGERDHYQSLYDQVRGELSVCVLH